MHPRRAGDFRVDVAIGDLTRVNIFVIQTGGNESRLSDFGLLTAGLVADFNTGNGQVTNIIGRTLPLETGTASPLFRFNQGPDPTFDNTAGSLQIQGAIDLNDNRDTPGLNTGAAFVGFFEFEALQEGDTVFTLSDPNTVATVTNNTLNNDPEFTDLDAELFCRRTNAHDLRRDCDSRAVRDDRALRSCGPLHPASSPTRLSDTNQRHLATPKGVAVFHGSGPSAGYLDSLVNDV